MVLGVEVSLERADVASRPEGYYTTYEIRRRISVSDREWSRVRERVEPVWWECLPGVMVAVYSLSGVRRELRALERRK